PALRDHRRGSRAAPGMAGRLERTGQGAEAMSENEIKPVYPKIDHMQLDADGGYYCRHVAAMTDEGLHRKSEIAGQLGMRDRAIDRLTAERDALREQLDWTVRENDR